MSKTVEKLNIYCLYDVTSEEQMPLFQMSSDAVAIRNIIKMNIKGNIEFPYDLHLVRLGYLELSNKIDCCTLVSDYEDLGSVNDLTAQYSKSFENSTSIQGVKPNERS